MPEIKETLKTLANSIILHYASHIIRIIYFYNEKVSNDSMKFLEPKQQF